MNVEVASAEHRGVKRFMKLSVSANTTTTKRRRTPARRLPPSHVTPGSGHPVRTRRRPLSIAAVERAEDKIAAEKTSLLRRSARSAWSTAPKQLRLLRRLLRLPPRPGACSRGRSGSRPGCGAGSCSGHGSGGWAVAAPAPTKERCDANPRRSGHAARHHRRSWLLAGPARQRVGGPTGACRGEAAGGDPRAAHGAGDRRCRSTSSLAPWSEEAIDRAPSRARRSSTRSRPAATCRSLRPRRRSEAAHHCHCGGGRAHRRR